MEPIYATDLLTKFLELESRMLALKAQVDSYELYCVYEEDLINSLPKMEEYVGKNREGKTIKFRVWTDDPNGPEFLELNLNKKTTSLKRKTNERNIL